MKNISTCLLLVVTACLLCLCASGERYPVISDDAIAMLPEPVPCCYNVPSAQSLYLGDQLASSLAKGMESQARMQFGTVSQLSFAEEGIQDAFWVKDREIYYGKLT